MGKVITIGNMAKFGNCKVQTIRYYEQIGLITSNRSQGNQRVYTQANKDRLMFIRHSRELGFSLEQIRAILNVSDQPSNSCEDVDQIARDHLNDVESKIKRLNKMKIELKRMINQCSGHNIADCKIVEVLSDHSLCQIKKH